jgi:hypothetical protein
VSVAKGQHMKAENEERLQHSLPGTNQGGKGAPTQEPDAGTTRPGADPAATIAHSLPGTNEAGKGARVGEHGDHTTD